MTYTKLKESVDSYPIVNNSSNASQHNKEVPINIEAEQALLGGVLLNNDAFESVSEFLKPQHFSNAIHSLIYETIGNIISRGGVANPITLKDLLSQNEDFKEIGGYSYLIELSDITYQTMLLSDYGRLIYDLYVRRQLIQVGHETMIDARIFNDDNHSFKIIEDTERKLFQLASDGQQAKTITPFSQALKETLEKAETAYKRDSHVVGVSTGLVDVDHKLGGLHPSDLLILAGRPSMGKTALATNIAFNAAQLFLSDSTDGAPVLFFSLEMSAEQLANRILSSESGISSDNIRRGTIKSDEFPKLVTTTQRITQTPLYIDDTPALTIAAVRNKARRAKRQYNIGMIVIDYLQLLSGGGKGSETNRVNEISEITRGLKALAKELNVPVIALSQLSREVEKRDDKRPQLSDLRESGSIEQDSDVVMFVYREEYYESRKEPEIGTPAHAEWMGKMAKIGNQAELIIAKQRHGPIANIKLYFDANLTKFGDLAKM